MSQTKRRLEKDNLNSNPLKQMIILLEKRITYLEQLVKKKGLE